jgi:hypothetical protein
MTGDWKVSPFSRHHFSQWPAQKSRSLREAVGE